MADSTLQNFLQPAAMGILLRHGWQTYNEAVAQGVASLIFCSIGIILGFAASLQLGRTAGKDQATICQSLFSKSCASSGIVEAMFQLIRLRSFSAMLCHSFLSSGFLGAALPHIIPKVTQELEAEIWMPAVLAALSAETICRFTERFPLLQISVSIFLLGAGLQGCMADVSAALEVLRHRVEKFGSVGSELKTPADTQTPSPQSEPDGARKHGEQSGDKKPSEQNSDKKPSEQSGDQKQNGLHPPGEEKNGSGTKKSQPLEVLVKKQNGVHAAAKEESGKAVASSQVKAGSEQPFSKKLNVEAAAFVPASTVAPGTMRAEAAEWVPSGAPAAAEDIPSTETWMPESNEMWIGTAASDGHAQASEAPQKWGGFNSYEGGEFEAPQTRSKLKTSAQAFVPSFASGEGEGATTYAWTRTNNNGASW